MDFSLPDRDSFGKIWARVTGAEMSPAPEGSLARLAGTVFRDEKLYMRAALSYRRHSRLFRRIAELKRRQLAQLQLMHFLSSGDTAGVSCAGHGPPAAPSAMFLRERHSAETALAERFELAAAGAVSRKEKELFSSLARQTRGFAAMLSREIALFMR